MDLDVILPFHRIDSFFVQALESISNTVEVEFRLILVDDRVNQDNQIHAYIKQFRNVEYVKTPGGVGYAAALETGTQFIATDVVALFNSDDLVHPRRFVNQVRTLNHFDISVTSMKRINEKGRQTSSFMGHLECDTFDPIFLLLGSYAANATWCMRKEWWQKNAFFDNEECLDWRIALRSFRNSEVHYSPEELYSYRKHSLQKTKEKKITPEKMWPVYLEWEKLWKSFDLSPVPYEAFNFLATPWNSGGNYDQLRINEITDALHSAARSLPAVISTEVLSLLRQRYLFALGAESSVLSSMRFLLHGIPGIPRLIRTMYS
jgi:glycosyltransferase involved in cell wall biosynthesis